MMSFAQQAAPQAEDEVLKNKRGHEILPVAGDIALGFNMIPVIDLLFGWSNQATAYAGSANTINYTSNMNNQNYR
jgi:hypothetical protein